MDIASKWIDRWSKKRQKLKELKETLDLSMNPRDLKR